jgi:seryl-tRNA synthetase
MFHKLFQLFFVFVIISGTIALVNAQSDATNRSGTAEKEDFPKGIKESLAKQRIEREKKDFAELIQRSEEAVKIIDELDKSFTANNQFSSEDQKKLDRLEKVAKKIRDEISSGDGEAEDKPLSILNALKALKSNTLTLVDELKKTSRYSISVIAVESSNALLKAVRFLRFNKK